MNTAQKSSRPAEEFGLNPELLEAIKAKLAGHSDIDKALIYGSRAIGNYRPGSDIDLCLVLEVANEDKKQQMPLHEFNQLQWQLDDLMSPYEFDVSIYQQIENPDFKDHINKVGKVIYKKS
jgi:predicted nucleotidyltransferase